nr:thioredoxin family protein [uncultured Flavobacterium sp.]
MWRKLYLLLFFLFTTGNYAQDSIVYFSDAVKRNIKPYKSASAIAFENKDFTEGKRLFDSLVQHKLNGTLFDDFTIKGYNSKKVILHKINKPILLVTYASWCVRNKGDAPALNTLANKYGNDLQIVIVFWDKKKNLKKTVNQFNSKIKICYANEAYQNDFKIVATLKHTLGMPTVYYIDENKKVVTINRIKNQNKIKISKDAAFAMSYSLFEDMIRTTNTKLSLNTTTRKN